MSRPLRLALTYFALLVLLALTVGSNFLPLGFGNTALNLAIAAMKAALIAIVFMELRSGGPLPRLALGATLFWLLILFALSWIALRGV